MGGKSNIFMGLRDYLCFFLNILQNCGRFFAIIEINYYLAGFKASFENLTKTPIGT